MLPYSPRSQDDLNECLVPTSTTEQMQMGEPQKSANPRAITELETSIRKEVFMQTLHS